MALLLLVCLANALIVVDFGRVADPGLKAGEVATRDVKAPMAFTYVDEAATRLRQDEAVSGTPAVYDYDATLLNRVQERVAAAFDLGRRQTSEAVLEARAKGRSNLSDAERSALGAVLLKQLGVSLRVEDVELVALGGFDERVERLAIDLLAVGMSGYVAHEQVMGLGAGEAITVIRAVGEQRDEVLLQDLSAVRSTNDARDAVTLHVMEHYAEGEVAERARVAAAIARAMLRANFSYNQLLTNERRATASRSVVPVAVAVERGAALVRDGDVVTAQQVEALQELVARQGDSSPGRAAGTVFVLCGVMILAAQRFAGAAFRRFTTNLRDHAAMGALLVLNTGLARLYGELSDPVAQAIDQGVSPSSFLYAAPLAGSVLLVRFLVNAEASFVFAVLSAALAALALDQSWSWLVFFLVSGLVGAWSIGRRRERRVILRAGLLTGVANAVMVIALDLLAMNLGGITPSALSVGWDLTFALVGGMLSAFLVLALVPLFELVGFVTDLQLLELANLDHPLLRNLMMRAPGSYHHSVMVGALGEAAAEAVGANALQVRVCAYFHDIGKAVRPQYFVENQTDGVNRHERLTAYQSAQVIIDHVRDGGATARDHKLPQPIIDNIYMHHGDGLVYYFYIQALKNDPNTDAEDFRYPGPRPNTREAGILMLADKIEAACRSIKRPTPDNVGEMIQKIINSTLADGQLQDCPLTLNELYVIAGVFKTTVLAIHHHRIAYPDKPLPARRVAVAEERPLREAVITLEIPSAELAAARNTLPLPGEDSLPEDESTEVIDYESPDFLPPPVGERGLGGRAP